jgi:hypothetical protein
MKKRSGYSTINMIEASKRLHVCWGSAMRRATGSFTVETQERLANSLPPQSSCALLRQRCCRLPVFKMRSAGEAPRDAPPTPIEKQERHQHQDLQDHCPHTTHTNPPFLLCLSFGNMSVHMGAARVNIPCGIFSLLDVPPTLTVELGACWNYSTESHSLELCVRVFSARPSDRRTNGPCPLCPCPSGGFLIGMGNPESCPVQRMRAQAQMVCAPRKLPQGFCTGFSRLQFAS